MNWIYIVGYLFIQLAIGIWVSHRIKDEKDYFMAGRNLGPFAISFSLFATWFGAETCIGSAGAIYEQGLSGGRADPFGYSVNFFLLGLFVIVPLWKGGYMTLADFFKDKFGEKVEKLSVWVIIPSSLVWAAAQVKAFGEVIAATSPLDSTAAITLAAAFVIAYTFLGGLLGDIITDVIQGGILLITLVVTLFFTVNYLGGWEETLSFVDPVRLSLVSPGESILERVDRWFIPIVGAVFTQELISRGLAARTAGIARSSSYIAGIMYLTLGCIPAFLGLIGPKVLPGIVNVEEFLPLLAEKVLPQFLYILFSGALISAILSTVDSILLASSSLISHNFLVPYLQIRDEGKKVKISRVVVVICGVIAYILALSTGRIYDLVIFADSLGAAGVVVICLWGIFVGKGSTLGAMASLVCGLICMPLFEYGLDLKAPFLTSVSACLVSYLVFSAIEKKVPFIKQNTPANN